MFSFPFLSFLRFVMEQSLAYSNVAGRVDTSSTRLSSELLNGLTAVIDAAVAQGTAIYAHRISVVKGQKVKFVQWRRGGIPSAFPVSMSVGSDHYQQVDKSSYSTQT
jgi:hypothetical protein